MGNTGKANPENYGVGLLLFQWDFDNFFARDRTWLPQGASLGLRGKAKPALAGGKRRNR